MYTYPRREFTTTHKWHSAAWVALVMLALAACGDSERNATNPTFTPQQLSDALLTPGDLGAGWTETQRDVFATREPENPSIDPSLWCPTAKGDALVMLAGQTGADVELILGAPASPYIVRQQAWSNTDVERYLASVKAAVATCSGAMWNDDDGNSYTLAPSPIVPVIGDASISWKVTIQLLGATTTTSFTEQTAARFGNVMMVLQGGATPDPEANATAPNYVFLVRSASNKISRLTTR